MSVTRRCLLLLLGSYVLLSVMANDMMMFPPSKNGSDGNQWPFSHNHTDGCGLRHYTKSERDASGLHDWLRGELQEFNKHAKDEDEFIQNYLIPRYAPKMLPAMTDCYVTHECDIATKCDDFDTDVYGKKLDNQTKEYVLNTVIALSNLNGMFHDILAATDLAELGMSAGKEVLAEQFTYADEFDEYEDKVVHKRGMNAKSAWYLANAIIGTFDALGKVGVPLPPTYGLSDVWGSVFSWYLFVQTLDAPAHDQNTDHELVATRDLSNVLFTTFTNTRAQFLDGSREIMKGWPVGNTTVDIVSFLEAGDFTRPSVAKTQELEQKTMKAWYSAIISQLWETERIYGLEVDVVPGTSCQADRRGPQSVKVCLPEQPDHIYFIYGIPKFEERSNDRVTNVSAIPGWKKFEGPGYYGITQQDIVRSSKHYWDLNDNRRNLDVDSQWVTRQLDPTKKSTYGAFNVPMCKDAKGVFISSLNSKSGRTFPCDCAESKAFPGYDDRARTERNALFLHATGLRWSYDYNNMCRGIQKDRMHCDFINEYQRLDNYYPKVDFDVPINDNWCFNQKKLHPQHNCFALWAFTNCRPGYTRGDTSLDLPMPFKDKPQFRGYGLDRG